MYQSNPSITIPAPPPGQPPGKFSKVTKSWPPEKMFGQIPEDWAALIHVTLFHHFQDLSH